MNFQEIFETVQVWCKYNPAAASVIVAVTIWLIYLVRFRSRLNKAEKSLESHSDCYKPQSRNIEVRHQPLDVAKMSETCPGRLVPKITRNDTLTPAVNKVLAINYKPSLEEIVELLTEGGFDQGSWTKAYARDRVYAVLANKNV